MLRAIIFDFDGLILETEVADFQSWQEVYQSYGASLPLSIWLPLVGTGNSQTTFNAYDYLEQQIGHPLKRDEVRHQRRQRYAELVEAQPLLPGVEATIIEAKQRDLWLAVASSSSRTWVHSHLAQRQLDKYFSCVVCGDEVARTKPYPDVYTTALAELGIQAKQACALEDSPNGIHAAKQAGLFCIAVPSSLTRQMSFTEADMQLSSLEDLSLKMLIEHLHKSNSSKNN